MTQKKLEKDSKYNEMDANKDGVISDIEIDSWQQTEEVKRINRKQKHQRNMAWVAMISMVMFSIFLMLPMMPDSRVKALSDLLGLFYIAQASIVAAYFGATAFMSRR